MAKEVTTIRMTGPVKKLLTDLCTKRESTQSYIIEEAIRLLAKKEGLTK